MFGIGKKRSIFGQWIDRNRILQKEVEEETQLSQPIVTKACNDPEYHPSPKTKKSLLSFVRRRGWRDANQDDLWPM